MSWVKSKVIKGHQVTVGVLVKGGTDPQYDHEVSVVAIGTNYPNSDAYDPRDVLYFDDHGGYTLVNNKLSNWPAIPHGDAPGSDSTAGCTPYLFGYSFGSLPQTRKGANAGSAQAYSIIIPGVTPTYTSTGADGYTGTKAITGHNYGFSVSGAIDNSTGGRFLLPIQISIPNATTTGPALNPKDPIAGWQYENSMIGTSPDGLSCTNVPPDVPPQYWMNPMPLQVTISGLLPGRLYNLYEYESPEPDGGCVRCAKRQFQQQLLHLAYGITDAIHRERPHVHEDGDEIFRPNRHFPSGSSNRSVTNEIVTEFPMSVRQAGPEF